MCVCLICFCFIASFMYAMHYVLRICFIFILNNNYYWVDHCVEIVAFFLLLNFFFVFFFLNFVLLLRIYFLFLKDFIHKLQLIRIR